MGKNAANTRQNGTNKKRPYSNQGSELFFNKKPELPIQKPHKKQKTQQPVQEINLETATEILLAGILEELKTQNMIALMKLKAQEEQKQQELEEAEKMEEKDSAHFEEIRHSMYM